MQKTFGIVIPAANESESITAFCRALTKQVKKLKIKAKIFFIIDKVSKDDTLEKLKKISKKNQLIKVIYAPSNRSVVDAYVRGYKEALKKNCDYIIEMDCGFSHLPEELYKFIDGLNEGFDCVFGKRPLWSPSYKVPLLRRTYSLGGSILSNLLLKTKFSDLTSGYEGFTNTALKKIIKEPLLAKGHFFHTEIKYRARKLKVKEVSISYQFPSPNVRGATIINSFSTLIKLAQNKTY